MFRSIQEAYGLLVDGASGDESEWPFDSEEEEEAHATVHMEDGWTLDGAYKIRLTKLIRGEHWVIQRTFEADGSYSRSAHRTAAVLMEAGQEQQPQDDGGTDDESDSRAIHDPSAAELTSDALDSKLEVLDGTDPARPGAPQPGLQAVSTTELLRELESRGMELTAEELARLGLADHPTDHQQPADGLHGS